MTERSEKNNHGDITVNPIVEGSPDEKGLQNVPINDPLPKPVYDEKAAKHEIGYDLYVEGEGYEYTPKESNRM